MTDCDAIQLVKHSLNPYFPLTENHPPSQLRSGRAQTKKKNSLGKNIYLKRISNIFCLFALIFVLVSNLLESQTDLSNKIII